MNRLTKANWYLRLFGFFQVPLIWLCRPKIVAIDSQKVEVVIPLFRRTRNHLGGMYFGALAVGADVAGGFLAMSKAKASGDTISLAFKSVSGEFLKRPEGDVLFRCSEGHTIDEMLTETKLTGKRVNQKVTIIAYCPEKLAQEPVARFELELSVKSVV